MKLAEVRNATEAEHDQLLEITQTVLAEGVRIISQTRQVHHLVALTALIDLASRILISYDEGAGTDYLRTRIAASEADTATQRAMANLEKRDAFERLARAVQMKEMKPEGRA